MNKQKKTKQHHLILSTFTQHDIITMDFNCFISVVSTWMELQRSEALGGPARRHTHSQLDKVRIQSHMLSRINLL